MELLHLATGKQIPKGGKESVAEQFGVSIWTLERIWKRYWNEKLISKSASPVLAERKKGNGSKLNEVKIQDFIEKAKRLRHTNSIFENR